MNDDPMKFWLIQRGTLKNVKASEIVGIDSMVSFDYMGSAEFEYGTLPKALKSICGKLDSLTITERKGIKNRAGQGLFVICIPEDAKEILSFLNREAYTINAVPLKEQMYLRESIRGDSDWNWRLHNFWWDIENDWMCVFGKDNATNVVKALKLVKTKKGWT